MINPNSEDTLVFLYGPSVQTQPFIIEKGFKTNINSSQEYAIGNKKVELELGETKILAVYRKTESHSMSMIDFHDEEFVNQMIKQEDMVLLLKLKIEESILNNNE